MTVYFVRRKNDSDGLIKIGFSRDVDRRMKDMATATPEGFDLLCVIPGGTATERYIHMMLDGSWENGEWYRPTHEVLMAIEKAKAGELQVCEDADSTGRWSIEPADEFSDDIVRETRFYLNELVRREWQGMGDSVENARDRVMMSCGLKPSYGFRIWHKPKELKDLSGEAYRGLRIAYALTIASEGNLNSYQSQFLRVIGVDPTQPIQDPAHLLSFGYSKIVRWQRQRQQDRLGEAAA